ncbi:phosphodiester glycosidase family protein [Parabacteroides pacaensis]|uniref:phosphodiester glycosidase family protein n=1 Tax=Parabacteroides pacaensis TaxID=2086575 RepID=UPI000D0E9FF4|nr:phosphodiester glycosidase family protein [Parabacteroides pacaensis]
MNTKHFYLIVCLLGIGTIVNLSSCSKDEDNSDDGGGGQTSATPFTAITAADGDNTIQATIDDTKKTVTFAFTEADDLTAIPVTFSLGEGYRLVFPETNPATIDVSASTVVKVNNGKQDIIYRLSGTTTAMTNYIDEEKIALVGATPVITVNNPAKSITIAYDKTIQMDRVELDLSQALAEGVTVQSENLVYDFSNSTKVDTVALSYKNKTIKYSVKLDVTKFVVNPTSLGFQDVTTAYSGIPAHTKVYHISNYNLPDISTYLGDMDENPATTATKVDVYIAVVDMNYMNFEVVTNGNGQGVNASTTPDRAYEMTQADIILSGEEEQSLIVVNKNIEQITYDNEHQDAGRGAFGIDENGKFAINYAFAQGGKVYTVPAGNSGHCAEWISNGTAKEWKVTYAGGGYPTLMKNGIAVKEAEAWENDGSAGSHWDSPYARAIIGITYDYKFIAFVASGVGKNEGIEGIGTSQGGYIMKQLGCKDILHLEGSGSPFMKIVGQNTIKSTKTHDVNTGELIDATKQKALDYCIAIKIKE